MKHLVIDTGIYRKTPRLDSPEFKSLSYLYRKGCVQIHVPYVVEREFSTQLEHNQRKRISCAINDLRNAANHNPLGELSAELPSIISKFEQDFEKIVKERSAAFIAWIEEVGGQRHALSIEESLGALEAYFDGHPPLKEPKVRKDIPDAFIFQCVLNLKVKHKEELTVIVEDGALSKACMGAGIDVFSSLSDFLNSDAAKNCLAEKVIDDNIVEVLEKVELVAKNSISEIANKIENELLRDNYSMIYGKNLPGENNEIYVSGVWKPHEVNLHEFEHLGAGQFICSFDARVELMYEYPVYKFDAIDLDRDKFYTEPLNDHYFNVETTDEFMFTGRIELDFGEEILDCKTLDQLLAALEDPDINADELEDFQLAHEDS